MAYGDSSKVNTNDAVSIPFLKPGIYTNGRLIEVKKDLAGKETSEDKKPVLVFMFQSEDGGKHQHTEWDQGDNVTKATNQLSRIGSFIRQIIPDYDLPAENLNTWDDVRNQVIADLSKVDFKLVPLDFKVVGNVYKPTKPITQIPNYKGAVVASSKKVTLSFSADEIKDNQIYESILAGKYSPPTDGGLPPNPENSMPINNEMEGILGGDPGEIL